MNITRTHLAGLELALKELGEHGFELKAHAGYHLMPLIADAKAAAEAEPVATYMGTDWDAQNQFMAECADLEPGTELFAAPQHAAELAELLERVVDRLRKAQMFDLSTQVCATLATLRHV